MNGWTLGPWLAPLLLFLSACASYRDGAFEVVEGRFFDARKVSQITDHRTAEAEILEWFGAPLEVKPAEDGSRTLRYFAVRSRDAVERRLLRRRVHNQTVRQELLVRVSRGLVIEHSFTTKTEEKTS